MSVLTRTSRAKAQTWNVEVENWHLYVPKYEMNTKPRVENDHLLSVAGPSDTRARTVYEHEIPRIPGPASKNDLIRVTHSHIMALTRDVRSYPRMIVLPLTTSCLYFDVRCKAVFASPRKSSSQCR